MTHPAIVTAHRDALRERDFTAATVLRNLTLIASLFFVNTLGVAGNAVFFAALLLMSAKSSEHTVRALSLLYLVIVSNTALVNTGSTLFSAGKFLFLFVVAGRLLYSLSLQGRMPHRIPVLGPLALFCFVALMLAIEGGYFAEISALKLLSFFTGMVCIFAAVEAMGRCRHALNGWFLSIVIFVMLIGLYTWAVGLGYNAKTDYSYFDRYFNGPFYHPQTLGPASALIVVWLFGFGVLSQNRIRSWSWLIMPVFVVFLYMSSSRTSLLAMVVAMLVLLFMLPSMPGTPLRHGLRLVRHSFLAAIALVFFTTLIELAKPGSVVEPMLEFVVKNNSAGMQIQADIILSSRQSLIQMMMENIENNPWTGIGFGTSTHHAFVQTASIFRAVTEKGILPIAIVEENGFIGALFFLFLIISFFKYIFRSSNIMGGIGLGAMLGINMTEMNFFSFGGHGGFFWVWVMALMLMRPEPVRHRASLISPTSPAFRVQAQ